MTPPSSPDRDGPPPRVSVALLSSGDRFGGVERFIETLASGLRERGQAVVVILFHRGPLAEMLTSRGVDVEIVSARHRFDRSAIRQVAKIIEQRNIDVVHTNGYKGTIIGTLATRLARSVVVLKTEHGLVEPTTAFDRGKMGLYHALDRFVTSRYVDEVVYATRDLMERMGHDEGAGRVIHGGIAPGSSPASEARTSGKVAIGIVGRIVPVKGHSVLIRALSRMAHRDRVKVHVVGTGPDEDSHRRLAAAEGLGDSIEFHGFREDARAMMSSLDCVVMPSTYEGGVPYSLLEAMDAGIPVVASAVGGLKEALLHEETGLLVPPLDAEALAKALDRIVSDPEFATRLGAKARDEVARSFTLNSMTDRYLTLYLEMKMRLASDRIWLAWDRHRRSVELAKALDAPLTVVRRRGGLVRRHTTAAVKTALLLLRRRHRVVFVQNPSLVLTTIAAAIKPLRRYILVQDLHSYFARPVVEPTSARDRIYRMLSLYTLRRCDLTIVTNEPLRDLVEQIGGSACVLPDRVPDLGAPAHRRLDAAYNVVFICTYSPDEPVDQVLRAADLLSDDVRIYVTGERRSATELGLPPSNVTLTGFLPEEDYVSLLASADAAIVLTTRDNTLLCGAYEAVSLRKPIILSDTAALRTEFGDGAVYVAHTAGSIAQAIERVRSGHTDTTRTVDALSSELIRRWNERFVAVREALALLAS